MQTAKEYFSKTFPINAFGYGVLGVLTNLCESMPFIREHALSPVYMGAAVAGLELLHSSCRVDRPDAGCGKIATGLFVTGLAALVAGDLEMAHLIGDQIVAAGGPVVLANLTGLVTASLTLGVVAPLWDEAISIFRRTYVAQYGEELIDGELADPLVNDEPAVPTTWWRAAADRFMHSMRGDAPTAPPAHW